MNLRYIKLTVFIFLCIAFLGSAKSVAAINPTLSGRVVNSVTGAGVPNVWVKLTTSGCDFCTCAQSKLPATRYVQADSSGNYTFPAIYSWFDGHDPADVNRPIDTDLDGVNDAVVLDDRSSPNCIEPTYGTAVLIGEYGCGTVPQTIEVVKPVFMTGSFTQEVISFANAASDYTININDIQYTPLSVTNTPTQTPTPVASCSFTNLPVSFELPLSSSFTYSPAIVQSGGTVNQVIFEVLDSGVASVCASGVCAPALSTYTDSSPSFSASLSGYQLGNATSLRVRGVMNTGQLCTEALIPINVSQTTAWCQFKSSDALTNGAISCSIPPSCTGSNCYLISADGTQLPGVASAEGGVDAGASQISSVNWNANTRYAGTPQDYDYFEKKINGVLSFTTLLNPIVTDTTVLTQTVQNGYYWVRYEGIQPLEINADLAFGSNRVVLFVPNAEVRINGKISVTRGQGLFAVFAKDNIVVGDSVGGIQEATPVADLEGIYFTDGQFRTGGTGTNDSQLHVRGSVAALDRVVMTRSLSDNTTTPAELFEYGPDQILLFPNQLKEENISWREVAP